MEDLHVKSLYAAYEKKEVLRGVSVSAHAGEIMTIIGPNGSGKSTLLKVIAGFLKPLSGEVWLGDHDITSLAAHERVAHGLAYLMQGGRVFQNLTVKENLEVASKTLPAEEREKALAAAHEVFPRLIGLFEKRSGLLSGGERQALALAMMALRRPRFLLLDEPTAGLSPLLVQDTLAKIRRINTTWKTTILLVEHNFHEAFDISHRVLLLVHGEIVFETKHPQNDLTQSRLEHFFWSTAKEQTKGNGFAGLDSR
jgi:branched-chain amino acid transport system ATP-binding protein